MSSNKHNSHSLEDRMKEATNEWVAALHKNDADAVSNMFCSEGSMLGGGALIGTVSQTLRQKSDQETGVHDYFDYFANRKNIRVTAAQHNPMSITSDVGVNNVFATIEDTYQGATRTTHTRMSYVWKEDPTRQSEGKHGSSQPLCLALLHSSVVPEASPYLRDPSKRIN